MTTPLQIDMFSGEASDKKPKSGPADSSHVLLKERPKYPPVRGMAGFEGSGPAGKTCANCCWYGAVHVVTPKPRGSEAVSVQVGCAWTAKLTGRPVLARIAGRCACNHFKEGEPASLGWVIEEDGSGPSALAMDIARYMAKGRRK